VSFLGFCEVSSPIYGNLGGFGQMSEAKNCLKCHESAWRPHGNRGDTYLKKGIVLPSLGTPPYFLSSGFIHTNLCISTVTCLRTAVCSGTLICMRKLG